MAEEYKLNQVTNAEELVSIIMPSFNRETLIVESVESVLRQTYRNWELIVVDDQSTDNTVEIIKGYSKKDERVLLVVRDRTPKGAPVCRNIGLDKAKGKYIMFLDSDDLLESRCIERRVNGISKDDSLDFIVNQVGFFNTKKRLVYSLWSSLLHNDDILAFLEFQGWQTSSTFFRNKFLMRFRWDEKALSLQDWFFHFEILMSYPNYVKFPSSSPDVYMRKGHMDRISSSNIGLEKLLSRVVTLSKADTRLNLDKKEFLHSLNRQFFKIVANAVVSLEPNSFKVIYAIWANSNAFKIFNDPSLLRYLKIQKTLKGLNTSLFQSLVFRYYHFRKKEVFDFNTHREVPLDKPFHF